MLVKRCFFIASLLQQLPPKSQSTAVYMSGVVAPPASVKKRESPMGLKIFAEQNQRLAANFLAP
jgi:hypothetical protein